MTSTKKTNGPKYPTRNLASKGTIIKYLKAGCNLQGTQYGPWMWAAAAGYSVSPHTADGLLAAGEIVAVGRANRYGTSDLRSKALKSGIRKAKRAA